MKALMRRPVGAPTNPPSTLPSVACHAPTPRSEPILTTCTLTVSEVATIFIKSLVQSAADFLGKKIQGAVISVPADFTESWASRTSSPRPPSLVSAQTRSTTSSSSSSPPISPKSPKLLSTPVDARAEAKLRLTIEHTKRTISASPGAATCSVESLKEGLDYTGAINRMRFDMLAAPVCASISTAITSLLENAAVDPHDVDEVVYVGGTGALPGLDDRVSLAVGLREDVETPFARGTVTGGGVGDPTTILARGCAVQASLIESLAVSEAPEDKALLEAFAPGHKAREVRATTRTIGALFPDASKENKEVGGTWVPVVQKETALPARRIVSLDVALSGADGRFVVEVWEAQEGIRVEKVVESRTASEDDEDDEEPEEVEAKHRTVTKTTLLAAFDAKAKLGVQTKGKGPDAGKWFTRVEVGVVVGLDGALEVSLREVGAGGVSETVKVPAL
ncbi:hypothetical protein D9619_012400 [Psilocybe cf. subviscida]|uniref:Uncharacterized protein n=1 Tax=Psilocybe cf. subviscida TaxID=2480587 RepID=A0A8H5ASQ4_9AGAR|nr:hypothetical protein D9619_012400 [Psilocybe cf. subviscida]